METTITYKTVNQLDIAGSFYKTNTANAPLVLFIHGGGLIWGTRHDMKKEQIELYLENGYNVLTIDYRLAPESKLPNIINDIKDATDWVLEEGYKQLDYDPKRVVVIGSSAGGYLALNTGTFDNKPKAIVSFYGYGDILADWYLKPSKHFNQQTKVPEVLVNQLIKKEQISSAPIEERYAIYLYCRQQGKWHDYVTGLDPRIYRDHLLPFCPVNHVDETFPPTMLLHGDQDEDVPYNESIKMQKALQENKVYTELVTIPNGKHTFDYQFEDPSTKGAFKKVLAFLEKCL